eukprot:scaffold133232_cov28-Tisochrysis_lutea.AAC.5
MATSVALRPAKYTLSPGASRPSPCTQTIVPPADGPLTTDRSNSDGGGRPIGERAPRTARAEHKHSEPRSDPLANSETSTSDAASDNSEMYMFEIPPSTRPACPGRWRDSCRCKGSWTG